MKPTLVEVIRKARRVYRASGEPNEAIMAIRMAYPDRSLIDAQHFWNWMRLFTSISATELRKWWCEKHWQPVGKCGTQNHDCARPSRGKANTAGAGAFGGTKPVTEDDIEIVVQRRKGDGTWEDSLSEPIPPLHRAKATAELTPQASASALIEGNKDRCPCGRKPCSDEFHASLAALIRKHGTSRAVELIHIWMGLKEPENEEQAQMVEAQPGYKPFYKEQQQND